MIILGDVSGIQRYLFDVSETGGGQARRLRARSFLVQLLVDCAALRVLDSMGWSLGASHFLFSGAGKFILQGSGEPARIKDRGKNPESVVSPATINKDLRHLKVALRKALEWNYLHTMPKIRMVREPEKLPRFVTAEHVEAIYKTGCEGAVYPKLEGQVYSSSDWWRALVVIAYMTGMRIKEILSIRREDVDFEAGQLITRAKDNKGKRDERIPLHPVVIEHLRCLAGNSRLVFCWDRDYTLLWNEFKRIQRRAGIKLACPEDHKHTPSCHVYGFHDFRRSFATVNAPRMKAETLQKLMRHKSYKTTMGYVNLTTQIDEAVANMPVPEVLRKDEKTGTDIPDAKPAEE